MVDKVAALVTEAVAKDVYPKGSVFELRLRNNLEKLPKLCATINPQTCQLIVIQSGFRGYKVPSNGPKGLTVEELRVEVDRMNRKHGITRGQERAMFEGSLQGFGTKAADPDCYDATTGKDL